MSYAQFAYDVLVEAKITKKDKAKAGGMVAGGAGMGALTGRNIALTNTGPEYGARVQKRIGKYSDAWKKATVKAATKDPNRSMSGVRRYNKAHGKGVTAIVKREAKKHMKKTRPSRIKAAIIGGTAGLALGGLAAKRMLKKKREG